MVFVSVFIRDGHADTANAESCVDNAGMYADMLICASAKYGAWPI